MPDVLIRHVPAATLAALKVRARKNGRSLQSELAMLLQEAAQHAAQPSPEAIAAAIRAKLAQPGRAFSDSTDLIREDRAR